MARHEEVADPERADLVSLLGGSGQLEEVVRLASGVRGRLECPLALAFGPSGGGQRRGASHRKDEQHRIDAHQKSDHQDGLDEAPDEDGRVGAVQPERLRLVAQLFQLVEVLRVLEVGELGDLRRESDDLLVVGLGGLLDEDVDVAAAVAGGRKGEGTGHAEKDGVHGGRGALVVQEGVDHPPDQDGGDQGHRLPDGDVDDVGGPAPRIGVIGDGPDGPEPAPKVTHRTAPGIPRPGARTWRRRSHRAP